MSYHTHNFINTIILDNCNIAPRSRNEAAYCNTAGHSPADSGRSCSRCIRRPAYSREAIIFSPFFLYTIF